jgi:hypothetical protein
VIDSFPYDAWTEEIAGFWTFGPGGSTGTYVLTVLGMIVMVSALIGWVWLEDRKLSHQAAALRAAAAMGLVPHESGPPHPGTIGEASQPPLAGPSTDPGD